MRIPLSTTAGRAVGTRTFESVQKQNAQSLRRPVTSTHATRRYQVACLGASLEVMKISRVAPAIPFIDAAFSAMAHGTLISTWSGQVAIEDLIPGTPVATRDNGYQPLLWIGSITLVLGQPEAPQHLLRITADGLGPARPGFDLVLGPGARLLHRHYDGDLTLAPIAGFCDGDQVIQTRSISPVQLFHVAFARHQIIRANGVEIESYHPGLNAELHLRQQYQDAFIGLFPNFRSPDCFGRLAYPRVSEDEMYGLHAS